MVHKLFTYTILYLRKEYKDIPHSRWQNKKTFQKLKLFADALIKLVHFLQFRSQDKKELVKNEVSKL
jgi:hypothetical protein